MAEQQAFHPGVSLAGAVDLEALKHQVKAEPGQAGGAPAAGGYVIDTTENTFQAMVQTSATFPILLFLWVPTDDRLFAMARALGDAVNKLNGQIQLSRIDIASNPSIAQAFQIQGAPALFALIGGRPMPILQGLPSDEELQQITDVVVPKLIAAAQQAGRDRHRSVFGRSGFRRGQFRIRRQCAGSGAAGTSGSVHAGTAAITPVPPPRTRRFWKPIRTIRAPPRTCEGAAAGPFRQCGRARGACRCADKPDDVDVQLAVADIDMIGGQIQDAFDRLLDFVAAGHKADIEPVRQRLLEYFTIPEPTDRASEARTSSPRPPSCTERAARAGCCRAL